MKWNETITKWHEFCERLTLFVFMYFLDFQTNFQHKIYKSHSNKMFAFFPNSFHRSNKIHYQMLQKRIHVDTSIVANWLSYKNQPSRFLVAETANERRTDYRIIKQLKKKTKEILVWIGLENQFNHRATLPFRKFSAIAGLSNGYEIRSFWFICLNFIFVVSVAVIDFQEMNLVGFISMSFLTSLFGLFCFFYFFYLYVC